MLDDALPLIVGSSGVTGVLVATITAVFNRRKLKADATSVITTAAGGIVQILQTDNGRLRAENARAEVLRQRKEAAERKRDALFRRQLEIHHDYDVQVAGRLREAGFDVIDPPPLEFPDYEYDREIDFIESDTQTQNRG